MKILRSSFVPGITVAALLEVAGWLYLFTHASFYTGSPSTWNATLVVWALFPLTTLASLWLKDRHWALRLILLKALLLFWSSVGDGPLLPGRWLVFAALVAQACTVLPRRWKLAMSTLIVVELVLIEHLFPDMTKGAPDAVTSFLVIGLVVLPGILLSWVQRTRAELEVLNAKNDELHTAVLQLTSANTEFLEQANTASEESAQEERHRITRDLHDVVGQTLTNLIMMMDATLHRKVHEPEETVKLLKWIRKQAQTGLEETRAVLYELRALRPGRLRGLQALKKLIETFSRLSGIQTRVEWHNLPWTFDPDQEDAVYHLVQASLSNAFRHGSATEIDLHFGVDRGQLTVMVRDNGKGGPDSALGIGQRGMEERLARWGGKVSFRSEPFGYVVRAELPLKEETLGPDQDPDRR